MNSSSKFRTATKNAVFLKLAITGPSASGKTTAALRHARGLIGTNGKIAVIDTENFSSLLYATSTISTPAHSSHPTTKRSLSVI